MSGRQISFEDFCKKRKLVPTEEKSRKDYEVFLKSFEEEKPTLDELQRSGKLPKQLFDNG